MIERRFFLVRTRRYPYVWQPVGGHIDSEDNNPEMAATREVREEIGVARDRGMLQKVITVPYDFGEGTVHCFSVLMRNIPTFVIDQEEIVEGHWFPLKSASDLPAYPAMKVFLRTLSLRLL